MNIRYNEEDFTKISDKLQDTLANPQPLWSTYHVLDCGNIRATVYNNPFMKNKWLFDIVGVDPFVLKNGVADSLEEAKSLIWEIVREFVSKIKN